MKTLVTAVTIGLLLASLMVAQAQQEVVVKIKSVDQAGASIVLEDGTKVMVPDGGTVKISELKPGQSIKVSFEEKGGQKVVKTLVIQPGN